MSLISVCPQRSLFAWERVYLLLPAIPGSGLEAGPLITLKKVCMSYISGSVLSLKSIIAMVITHQRGKTG